MIQQTAIRDPAVGEVELLLGPAAAEPVEALIAQTGDGLEALEIGQISYRPGRRITVVYSATTGIGTRLPVVLGAGQIPDGATLLETGSTRLGGWIVPHDPALPGLAGLFDDRHRTELLAPLGVAPAPTTARLRSYRPGKRAVVEVTGAGIRLFVKTIRPDDVAALQEAHTALAPALPIPRSLGWSPEAGIVVLEPIGGTPLSQAVGHAPDPSTLFEVLDRIPPLDRRATSRKRKLAGHLRLLRRVAPHREPTLASIESAAGTLTDLEPAPVHGDFHTGQVLVDGGRLVGVVDIDTVGLGQPVDDCANLLAHLHVHALRDRSGATAAYGERAYAAARRRHEVTDLRIRTAATLLGYASGPWSRQESGWEGRVDRLVDAAAEWIS
ncbi:MAG TPA: phosphotransferase [Acidimicrobiia bacterium]